MDETNQQTDSNAVQKDSSKDDSTASVTVSGEEEVKEQPPEESTSDASNKDPIIKSPDTNGVDNESITHAGDNCNTVDSPQSQERKTSNDNFSDVSVINESLDNCSKEGTNKQTETDLVVNENTDSVLENSKSVSSEYEKNEKECVFSEVNDSGGQLAEGETKCNESELSENCSTIENHKDTEIEKNISENPETCSESATQHSVEEEKDKETKNASVEEEDKEIETASVKEDDNSKIASVEEDKDSKITSTEETENKIENSESSDLGEKINTVIPVQEETNLNNSSESNLSSDTNKIIKVIDQENSEESALEKTDLPEEKECPIVIEEPNTKQNSQETEFIEIENLESESNEEKNISVSSEEKKSKDDSIEAIDDAKKDNLDSGNNNLINESDLSTNTEQEENVGNDIMETEIVNCNEIEQVDVNENEGDLKGDSRDEEVADSLETGDKNNEDHLGRDDNESQKSEILVDDDVVIQPGNSEEETITGDTTSQPQKEKEEEVCIIPDDVIAGLSILPEHKRDVTISEEESEGMKIIKVSESEKPKTRAQEKKNQITDSKTRPIRNAAKLAGNKIKSLVESDLVFEEQTSNCDLEGDASIQENTDESAQMCAQCREVKVCKLLSVQNDSTHYLCSEQCSVAFKNAQMDVEPTETPGREYIRKCSQCHSQITVDETRLFWETMDFCNEDCLGKYQLELGSNCANCKKSVPSSSLGKYCVRFGYDVKQFCSAVCLEEYKKGLKVCSYCQKDISTGVEGFLAPVGNKGQFKDFCTQSCMEKYDRMSSNKPLPDIIEECAVCSNSKPVQIEVELDNKTHKLCSEPCFAAFKFVNNITEGQCDMCRKYFDRSKIPKFSLRLLFYDETLHSFCSKTCMNVYILANRKIVPCNWCKVKKYNFDMIKKVSPDGQLSMMCSLNCLMLYQTSVSAICSRPIKCDFCKKKFVRQPLYHLTMSDATLRNFCSYNCVVSFQNGYPKQKIDVIPGADQLSSPIPTGGPKRLAPKRAQLESTCVPVISSVQSLASPNGPVSPTGRVTIPRGDVNIVPQANQSLTVPTSVAPLPAPAPQIYQQIITKPVPAKQMKNKSVLCKPYSHTKGVSCRPHPCMKETQTDQSLNRKFLIPIPVPIYVPAPMHMFSAPFPVPVPFPLPIPVPIFIPTTRNSAKGIMKEIKKIQEKIPTDPFEAELLMMAEMVAEDKKQDPTDSESEEGNDGDDNADGTFSPENVDTSNTFGDDMLQMALKMASELEEPAVDMESVLTSNTITTSTQPPVDPNKALYASDTDDPDQVNVMTMNRGRKRSVRGSRNSTGGTPSKRGRRTSGSVDVPLLPPPEPVPPRTIEVEKPDANMCLKYTFGVNAWRHWVMQKNAELEKAALTNRKIKLFKPELLQLTADELNFSLCLFVKEVRKPNGTEYAPDTIYYLCLGIQQYLFENGRIDNIFTDSYYEKFTDCLDEVAKKFAALYNDSQYIVTRVEEEHLWESKQLGAHSPHVLLSTLMFFNTKHFNLVTVEEHMQLSFSHIMKHWKRNPNTPGVAKVPGSRNVLLRFYPPQSALEANSRKKKVYEQQENEENPLRCPVKLYEFYLSKCPESVKTRNDVFYLLPERSCVPDSPVWYSTMALGKEPLMKMLHRIKMVKEINIALLTS